MSAALLGLAALGITSCGKPKSADQSASPDKSVVPAAPESGAAKSEAAPGDQTAAGGAMAPGQNQTTGSTTSPGGSAPGAGGMAPAPGGTESPYATAEVLVRDLVSKLQAGDWSGFLDLAGPQAATGTNRVRLRSLLMDRQFRVSGDSPVAVTDQSESAKRLTVNLSPGPQDTALGAQKLELDLVRDPTGRWGVADLRVPDILEIAAAKMAAEKAAPGTGDPLKVAGQFLDAVIKKDFQSARRHVDQAKVSDEKLAALFIAVEDESFKPGQKPLIPTIVKANVAWVIAKLESPMRKSDFGLEMFRPTDAAPWQIVGLNFSQLIQKVAMQAGAGDVAYSPLETDPKGGDHIVIYFEFDGAVVNPRAEKQLKIIGDILRADPKRTLTINGFADALGMDDYNKNLSQRRAEGIRQFLATYGIPGGQIITQGFGEEMPKAPNVNPDGTDNPSGRAQNRRAEVYLKF